MSTRLEWVEKEREWIEIVIIEWAVLIQRKCMYTIIFCHNINTQILANLSFEPPTCC